MILVGIDEAGYGPLLGPLVVTAAAFEVPAENQTICLWRSLKRSISRKITARNQRIPVLDSKKLYQRNDGLARLERSVLSMLGAWRDGPLPFRQLLNELCPAVLEKIAFHPWYGDAELALPVEADGAVIRLGASALRRDLHEQSIRLAGFWSEVMLEQDFNEQVRRTDNKSIVSMGLVLRLIYRIAQAYPKHPIRFCIDKQGGRDYYGQSLLTAFEGRKLKIVEERDGYSAYELSEGISNWHLSFNVCGEEAHMPIALASMVSKYLRELFMTKFNAYWTAQIPGIKPTAGYNTDGWRFFHDIKSHLPRLGFEHDRILRYR